MVKVSHLSKDFETKEGKLEALHEVSFEIKDGEIFGIIGKSGAGKTTLLRILSQLERPSSGEVSINNSVIAKGDKVITNNKIKKTMGVVFQGYNLLMQKTVARNIEFPLKIAGVNKTKWDKRVNDLLRFVDLEDKKEAYPATLSGGQKQRVAIARALANSPKILLLDEPTSALDTLSTSAIISLLQKINQEEQVTIIIVTHEIGVVKKLCQRIAVINEGKVVDYGTVQEVFANPSNIATKQLLGV
ncbi:MAG: ATP-binding cassette domain-containing protein [Bacilli bacterium]